MKIRDEYNQRQIDTGEIGGDHLTPLTSLWQKTHGLPVDGKCGPNTRQNILQEADTDPMRKVVSWNTEFVGPLEQIPRNRREVYWVFGDPSNGSKVNKKWMKENIRTYRKDMALPGVDPHRYVKLHKLAEPYVREALRRAAEVSDYKIKRFGGFNYRLMRSANRLSYHSWGIAFDINPDENRAIRYDSQLEAPTPWTQKWYDTWPTGMDQAFVEAIKSVGFGWGGDWKTFKDPQHMELVL